MSGRRDETLELAVGDGASVHPEAVDCHLVGWRLLRVVVVGTHEEAAAGNPEHALEWRADPFGFLRGRTSIEDRAQAGLLSDRSPLIPAKAGIQQVALVFARLGSRFRGNERR